MKVFLFLFTGLFFVMNSMVAYGSVPKGPDSKRIEKALKDASIPFMENRGQVNGQMTYYSSAS